MATCSWRLAGKLARHTLRDLRSCVKLFRLQMLFHRRQQLVRTQPPENAVGSEQPAHGAAAVDQDCGRRARVAAVGGRMLVNHRDGVGEFTLSVADHDEVWK